jgi:glycosyltransferase involved in cell wall biosynthesis
MRIYQRDYLHDLHLKRNCGGPVEKCVVVPYGVDLPPNRNLESDQRLEATKNADGERPLRVLTVGTVGLRKGSPYVLAAARRMKGKAQFRMVGPIDTTLQAQAELRADLELLGAVPRSEIAQHYRWADVFLLPSVCEGSATATYEALGYGLPVICTPNVGSVVREGIDGYILPIRDVDLIVDKLEQLANNPELRAGLVSHARQRAREFTVAAYGRQLLAALHSKRA